MTKLKNKKLEDIENKKAIEELIKFRAKEELKIKILKVIDNYKSKEEPSYNLTSDDIISVLASMLARKTR